MKHNKVFKSVLSTLALSTMAVMVAPAYATPISTNIVSIVDESGSMSAEHAWLPGMISSLDSALSTAAGLDPFNATYGLTGFGARLSHDPASPLAHKHLVGGSEFGSAGQFGTATGSLVTSGSTEDGHQAIDFVLNN